MLVSMKTALSLGVRAVQIAFVILTLNINAPLANATDITEKALSELKGTEFLERLRFENAILEKLLTNINQLEKWNKERQIAGLPPLKLPRELCVLSPIRAECKKLGSIFDLKPKGTDSTKTFGGSSR